jgi:sterol desaturase/sphingolipid hydroxylase (fatty acid hydroxylase superfamily)
VNPIAWAIPVFLATILAEAWITHRRGIAGYSPADAVTSLHYGVLSQVAAAFTRLLTLGIYTLAWEHLRVFSLPGDSLPVWLIALVFYDLCYYWAHRCGHEVNLLWAAHQVHHSSERYNLTTALRQSATGAFGTWPFYLPMAIAGVPPAVFAVVALVDLLYQYWVHTELVGRLGPLEKFLVTPSNHRVHHGQNDYCIDRNYGGILIVWDRLFGSFADERRDEPVVFGIRSPVGSFDPVWGNLKGYRDIWRLARTRRSVTGWLAVWFQSPSKPEPAAGGAPAGPAHGAREPADPALRRYALYQYALLVVPATHFIATATSLPPSSLGAYAVALVTWTMGVGAILDERPGWRVLEAGRVVALSALLLAWPGLFSPAIGLSEALAYAALALPSLLWLAPGRSHPPQPALHP